LPAILGWVCALYVGELQKQRRNSALPEQLFGDWI